MFFIPTVEEIRRKLFILICLIIRDLLSKCKVKRREKFPHSTEGVRQHLHPSLLSGSQMKLPICFQLAWIQSGFGKLRRVEKRIIEKLKSARERLAKFAKFVKDQ